MDQVVKKSVVLHPLMDRYVRHTQALLLQAEPPVDATYSTALNFMLLGLINEALKRGRLSADVRGIIWGFARDNRTIDHLNLGDRLDSVRNALEQLEPEPSSRK
jgi:hypothetical protein